MSERAGSEEEGLFRPPAADRDHRPPLLTATPVPPPRAPLLTPPAPPPAVPLSAPVAGLLDAVETVLAQVPVDLDGPQALADTAALLGALERLRGAVLPRLADVETRRLHRLTGAGSASAWVAQQHTSIDRTEVALARRLSSLPTLTRAVQTGALSVDGAQRVAAALVKLRRHLDRPDGLIDGLDGEAVVRAVVVDGISDLLLTAFGGLLDDDPRLAELLTSLTTIADTAGSHHTRLEAAFVLLATRLEPKLLPSALARLVDAVLPSHLEDRVRDAHDERGFTIVRNSDGSGWHITDGELDLETGELLHTVLQAEAAVDPGNPVDTAAFERARQDGWTSADGVEVLDAPHDPRSLRQRRHDALNHALRRYLDSGIAGTRDKNAPHLAVTVPIGALDGRPGALPAITGSGSALPASLLQRWASSGALTRFVLSLGRKVIETSHTERTLKASERRAKHVETGGRCQIRGCHCGPDTPLTQLVPHHPDAYARSGTTSLGDTALICDSHHHDIHLGRQTLQLRDGRWLDEHGWTNGPGT